MRRRDSRARPATAALVLCLCLVGSGDAQELLPPLATVDPANGSAWLEPLANGLMPALTAGFFTSGGRGAAFRFGVRYTATPFAGENETFAPRLPESVAYRSRTFSDPFEVVGGAGVTPTLAGAGPGAVMAPRGPYRDALLQDGEDPADFGIALPPGLGLGAAQVPLVEAGVSLRGLGVQLVGRFFPTVEISREVGHLRAFGGGILVAASRFAGVETLDVGLSAVTQKLDAGDYLQASGSAFGLVVSRDVRVLRLYATGAWTSGDVRVRYTALNPSAVPGLPPDGSRQTLSYSRPGRATAAAGLVLSAAGVLVSAEYAAASPDLFSVSVALGGR